MKSLAHTLRAYREKAQLRQSELARMLNISDKTISAWETEKAEPSLEMIDRVAEALNCTKADLLDIHLDSSVSYDLPFQSAQQATQYLHSLPMLSVIGNLDVTSLNDQESIELANDIIHLLQIASKNRGQK